MSGNVLATAAREAWRLLLWQAAWVIALAVVCALAWGGRAGWSALAGGGIGLIWTVYMALALARHSATGGARLGPVSFIVGWMIKVVLTLSLMVIAFRSSVIAPLPLLCGLSGALLAYWAWLVFRVRYANNADGK